MCVSVSVRISLFMLLFLLVESELSKQVPKIRAKVLLLVRSCLGVLIVTCRNTHTHNTTHTHTPQTQALGTPDMVKYYFQLNWLHL